VLVREQHSDLGLAEHRLEEPGGDVAFQEPLAVVGELSTPNELSSKVPK
jgi:hypothetical protein